MKPAPSVAPVASTQNPADADRAAPRSLQHDARLEARAEAREQAAERERAQAGEQERAGHGVSSSRRIDCCSASRRPMMLAAGGEQVEDPLVVDAVVDARALAPRLDEADPPQRREVLRRPARVEPELGLQRADRALALPEQLQDPHPRRMPEHPEEVRLDLVNLARVMRHGLMITP